MSVRERRDREREARRQAILDAARDLFVADGYEHVSIRKIAERIEYSPAGIYRYFTGKADIFFALAETGFRQFHRAMKSAARGGNPLETLKRRVWQYYRFSKAQPEYFALMFVDRSVPRISRDWERFAFMRETREETAGLVTRCIEAGLLPSDTDPDAAFHILATAMHGAAVIRLGGRFCPRSSTDALARDVLETTIAGLRSGVVTTFTAGASFHTAPGDGRGVQLPAGAGHLALTAREPGPGRSRAAGGPAARPKRRPAGSLGTVT
jgi:AcrR family transcriptional regulator